MRRSLLALSVLVGLAFTPAPALAHADLVATQPEAGGQVTAADEVRLAFDESVRPGPEPITVVGPDGAAITVGPPTTTPDGLVMSAPIDATAPGTYRVAWRAVSADDHVVEGEFEFVLIDATDATAAPATTGAPPTAPLPDDDDGDGFDPLLLVAALAAAGIAGVGAAWLVARRRR